MAVQFILVNSVIHISACCNFNKYTGCTHLKGFCLYYVPPLINYKRVHWIFPQVGSTAVLVVHTNIIPLEIILFIGGESVATQGEIQREKWTN